MKFLSELNQYAIRPNGWCMCWPGSLLAQMGFLSLPFDLQVKEVYLGKQSFSKETGWHMT